MFIPLHDTNSLKNISRQYVTLSLIAINVLIWLVMGTPAFLDQDAVYAAITSYGFIPAVVNGYATVPVGIDALPPAATYISYSFLHGDFMHLAGNMLFIWVFGDNVEDAMGHFRFLIFYALCAIAGAYAHSWMVPQSQAPLIGASGAVAGIIGAYLLLHPKVHVWVLAMGRIPLKIPAMYVLGFWIAFQFYQVIATPDSAISFAAHIGGAIAGIALIFFMRRPGVVLFDKNLPVIKSAQIENKVRKAVEPVNKEKIEKRAAGEPKTDEKPASSRRTSVPSSGKKSSTRKWGR